MGIQIQFLADYCSGTLISSCSSSALGSGTEKGQGRIKPSLSELHCLSSVILL